MLGYTVYEIFFLCKVFYNVLITLVNNIASQKWVWDEEQWIQS